MLVYRIQWLGFVFQTWLRVYMFIIFPMKYWRQEARVESGVVVVHYKVVRVLQNHDII